MWRSRVSQSLAFSVGEISDEPATGSVGTVRIVVTGEPSPAGVGVLVGASGSVVASVLGGVGTGEAYFLEMRAWRRL